MEKKFEKPELTVVLFTQEDIITASDFDSIRSGDDEGNMTIGF